MRQLCHTQTHTPKFRDHYGRGGRKIERNKVQGGLKGISVFWTWQGPALMIL